MKSKDSHNSSIFSLSYSDTLGLDTQVAHMVEASGVHKVIVLSNRVAVRVWCGVGGSAHVAGCVGLF